MLSYLVMAGMNQGAMSGMSHGSMSMRSVVNVNDPMTRESSGTAWTADSTPMYAWMKTFANGDMLMLHGTMFARFTTVGSNRDVSIGGKGSRSRFDAPSMFMAMYSHQLNNRSQIGVRAMLSLDLIIERGYGYPPLYQSGEAFRGRPIHDGEFTNAFLFESNYQFQKNSVFGRVERVQKSAHELVLENIDEHKIFNVGLYSLGYVRDLTRDKGIDVGLGAQATLYTNPAALNSVYGGDKHGGFQIFLRFRPSRTQH